MKIDKNKKVISIMLLISMILSVFIPINKVFAKEINNAITAFTITDENNKPLGSVGQYDQFKIHGEFELEDNIVEEGDTTTIKLPSKLTIGDTMNFDLKDPKGNIVARATVDKEKKTITLTYTDYSESHSGVNGSFYYYARVDSEVVTEKEKFPVEIDVEGEIIKAGEIDYEGPSGKPADNYLFKGSDPDPINKNIIKYHLFINRSNKSFENLVITDKMISTGVKVHINTVRIQKGSWIWNDVTSKYEFRNEEDVTGEYNVVQEGTGFSINLGNISQDTGFKIFYDGEMEYLPIDGEKIYNEAKLDAKDEKTITTIREHVYREAGGQAEGYVYKIDILKKGENEEVLAGAEFDVIRERNNAVVGKITTDKDGKGSIEKLLKDKYILKETKAPNGYELLNEDIVVEPGDFNNTTKIALKEIVNKKVVPKPTTVDLEATKTLEGRDLTADEFTFQLKDSAGDVVKEVKNALDGTVLFDGISIPKAGDYEFTIEEVDSKVAGITYSTVVYKVKVTATINAADNSLTTTVAYFNEDGSPATDVKFENKYTKPKPTLIKLDITKKLFGKDLKANQFKFNIQGISENTKNIKEFGLNDAEGKVIFKDLDLTFTEEGVYKYKVFETKGRDKKIKYDDTEYEIEVTVELGSNNEFELIVKVNGRVQSEKDVIKLEFINYIRDTVIGGDKNK